MSAALLLLWTVTVILSGSVEWHWEGQTRRSVMASSTIRSSGLPIARSAFGQSGLERAPVLSVNRRRPAAGAKGGDAQAVAGVEALPSLP